MPELPDVEVYREAILRLAGGRVLQRARALTPFVLRSVSPSLAEFAGLTLRDVGRMGKRLVLDFGEERYLLIHLMIAGRLLWRKQGTGGSRPGGKIGLAAFEFESGILLLTEASTHKRATLHAISGKSNLEAHRPPGIEPLECTLAAFDAVLRQENRTLKRALTNPSMLSGIGNAYSDEILHGARLSPLKLTTTLTSNEMERLFAAVQATLQQWTHRLKAEFGDRFPDRGEITAFRPDFAAHGKFGKPCPDCGNPIQRIQYAENETNYCAKCQNEGRVLADRSLSRLLKNDWPRTLEEMSGG